MPTWRFRWSQCMIFTGPNLEVTSDAWRCTPTCSGMHACAACTCMRTAAGRGICISPKVRAKHNLSHGCIDHVDAVVWNLELTCWLLWASFQFTHDHERPQSCWEAVAHVPEPTLRSKVGSMDKGKLSRAAFVRESNQTRSLKSLSVRNKTKRSCTTVARL